MSHENEGKRFTGEIKSFRSGKGEGFGFVICAEACPDDIFIHLSFIRGEGYKTLKPGWTVELTLAYNEKDQPQAHDVEVIETAQKNGSDKKASVDLDEYPLGYVFAGRYRGVIDPWDPERGRGFINRIRGKGIPFGEMGVYVRVESMADEGDPADIREGVEVEFQIIVSRDPAGVKKLRAIRMELLKAPSQPPERELLETEVWAIVDKFNNNKGHAETNEDQPRYVAIKASDFIKGHDPLLVTKGDIIIFDIVEGDEGPEGINIRLAGEQTETSMSAAFKATNGNGKSNGNNGDDPKGVGATEAIVTADAKHKETSTTAA